MSARGPASADSGKVFAALRDILLVHRASLTLVHDVAGHVYANCARPDARGKPAFLVVAVRQDVVRGTHADDVEDLERSEG